MRCLFASAVVATAFGLTPAAPAPAASRSQAGSANVTSADAHFRNIVELVRQQRLEEALREADRLIVAQPNFRLAHLVRGDILLARTQPIFSLGSTHPATTRVEELRAEARARLHAHVDTPGADLVPRNLLQLSSSQRHIVLIDAGRSRVYVYANADGRARLVAHYYSSIGKQGFDKNVEGDQKTPIGVYHVNSHIAGTKLPDLYGWGAFPINYPNEWDRLTGKTGHGIWLHGVPSDNYARAPRSSDGCVVLANAEMEDLARHVQVGFTPVIIADRVEWISADAATREREQFLRALDSWRLEWESLNTGRYLAHYSKAFRSDSMSLDQWAAHKHRVNAAKTWLKVSLSNLSIFRSPGKRELLVVTFDQDYRSSSHAQQTRKRQYWLLENGHWKIAYEGPIADGPLRLPGSYTTASRETRAVQTGASRARRQNSRL